MSKLGHPLVVMLVLAGGCLSALLAGCQTSSTGENSKTLTAKSADSGPPQWAAFTITLLNIEGEGPEALAQAQTLVARIRSESSWEDVHVIQTELVTKICRGYFKSFDTREAQNALHQVQSYKDRQGQRPFERAVFAALPGSTPKRQVAAGPPEWDFREAPGMGTLCIGFYVNDESCKDRVASALAQVKKLRGEGVEAWYYHGEFRSGVYVGHFDAAYEWVVAGQNRYGEPIMRLKYVTHDPQFAVMRKRFPAYEVNGRVEVRKIGDREVFDSSRLIPIPQYGQEVLDSEVGL